MPQKETNVGDTAPDFTLKDHHGNDVTLSGLKGKQVVLGFHPLAWTGVCTQQMKDLEASADRMDKLNAVALGISVDSTPCKKAWAESMGVEKIRLLSDFWPHGAVAIEYGIFRDEHGTSKRAVLILDDTGKVKFKKIYPIPERPDIEEIIAQL
ncbi:MAG: peroxiredoxin [Candidatus Eisenbacteria bacterium]